MPLLVTPASCCLAGGRIFKHRGFIHAKAAVSDGKLSGIGAINLTNRSFALSFKINAFIYDHRFARQYEDIFLNEQADCLELTADRFASRPRAILAAYNAARLFAPLM